MSFIKSKASSNAPASPFQSGVELRSLTGVRGVAALVVALAHFNLPAFAAFNGLFIGSFSQAVGLFFCLSGFTLALVYEPQTRTFANWRNYAVARIARIYPLYLATLLWSALIGISLGPQYPLERAWSDFLAQLALINSWPIVGTGGPLGLASLVNFSGAFLLFISIPIALARSAHPKRLGRRSERFSSFAGCLYWVCFLL